MHIAEIKRPTPTIAIREIKIETKNKIIEPLNGTWKNVITIPTIIIVKLIAIINGGMDLPNRISKDDKGLTISWSKVPSSLSRAIDNAVKIKVETKESRATITVKIYHLYSRLGLNQFLTVGFICVPVFPVSSALYPAIICEAYPAPIDAEFVCLPSDTTRTFAPFFRFNIA